MTSRESNKFHLFKHPPNYESTYAEEKCNLDATPATNRVAHHGRLSLLRGFILLGAEDKRAMRIRGEFLRE
jgi:hypothetical protein